MAKWQKDIVYLETTPKVLSVLSGGGRYIRQ